MAIFRNNNFIYHGLFEKCYYLSQNFHLKIIRTLNKRTEILFKLMKKYRSAKNEVEV